MQFYLDRATKLKNYNDIPVLTEEMDESDYIFMCVCVDTHICGSPYSEN